MNAEPLLKWFRRALAIAELFGVVILASGLIEAYRHPRAMGSDGIAGAVVQGFTVPLILIGVGVSVTAYKTWTGAHRWWVWQVSMPLWITILLVISLIGLAITVGD